jgi:hypothetical protein
MAMQRIEHVQLAMPDSLAKMTSRLKGTSELMFTTPSATGSN